MLRVRTWAVDVYARLQVATVLTSLIAVPWSITPILGFISDNLPIGGYRRWPYIFLCLLFYGLMLGYFGYSGTGGLSVQVYFVLRVIIEVQGAWMVVNAQAVVVQRSEHLSMYQVRHRSTVFEFKLIRPC